MKQLKPQVESMILCSAGDFYSGGNAFNEPKDHFVARIMAYLKYDAIAVGEKDLSFGLKKLVEDWKSYSMNLLCANLFWRDDRGERRLHRRGNKLVFPAYRVVSRSGLKIGFVSILSPQTKVKPRKPDEGGHLKALTYIIEDPAPIAKELVPKIRKKCDVLVLLAHMDRTELEKLLPELPEVNIAIVGHSSTSESTKEPYLMGTVPVYMATFRGQLLGAMKITLDPEKKIADTRNNIYTLDKTIPDDKEVAGLIVEFEEENRKLQKELYARQMLTGGAGDIANQDIYLGVGKCVRCHMDDFKVYIETKHAKAYSALSSLFMQRDSNCIGCHSTGYGKPGGFAGTRVIGSPVDLVDVQCEACHGPGAEHSRDGRYASRALESCTQCHSKEQDPTFNFSDDWEKIAH